MEPWMILVCIGAVLVILFTLLSGRKKKSVPEPVEQVKTPVEPAEEPVEAVETAIEVQAPAEPVAQTPAEERKEENVAAEDAVGVRYRTSFMARLIQSDEEVQGHYSDLKNAFLSYKNVKSKINWTLETVKFDKKVILRMNIKGKNLLVYFALPIDAYSVQKYHFLDVSDTPALADTPMLLKVRSARSLKYALELWDEVVKQENLTFDHANEENFRMPFESNEALAEKNLVKRILPTGMSASEVSTLVSADVGKIIDSYETDKESND